MFTQMYGLKVSYRLLAGKFTGAMNMSIDDIARQFYESFNDRNIEEIANQYIHEDCVSIDGPTGIESYGPEGSIESAHMWMTAFPDGKIKILETSVSGNMVTTIFRAQGTFTGEMMSPDGNIPGTGKMLDLEFEDVLEFEDGMIVRNETHYNINDMMSQLGLG